MPNFQTNKNVKIWFSKPDKHPLGHHINVCRLRELRRKFPNDVIHLVSNYQTFKASEKKLLTTLCDELKINLVDFTTLESHIKDSNLPDEAVQLKLLEIAKLEAASECGSLAASSDIVRVLSPISKLGIYSDLDDIKEKCDPELEGVFGLFLDVSYTIDKTTGEISVKNACNTPIACDERQNSFLTHYRKLMLDNYTVYARINMFLQIMQNNTFLDEAIIKTVRASMTLTMRQNLANKQDSIYPLILKEELRKLLTPDHYQKIIKMLVLFVSGPNCMVNAMSEFLKTDFQTYCYVRKLDLHQKATLLGSISICDVFKSKHQNDTAWVATEDDTQKNYETYYRAPAAKVIGRAVLNWWQRIQKEKIGHIEDQKQVVVTDDSKQSNVLVVVQQKVAFK